MSGPENVPHGTLRICWGCQDPISHNSSSDYCEVCRVSIRLIRKLQEDGSRIFWVMPWQHASRETILTGPSSETLPAQ